MGLMSDKEAEIAAWVMACEGSLSVYSSTRSNLSRTNFLELKPVIAITNTDLELLDRFKFMVGRGRIRELSRSIPYPNSKPAYQWFIRDMKNCYELCLEILPYMPSKKRQVELMIDFCKRSPKLGGPTRRDLDADWAIHREMKELNKKGV